MVGPLVVVLLGVESIVMVLVIKTMDRLIELEGSQGVRVEVSGPRIYLVLTGEVVSRESRRKKQALTLQEDWRGDATRIRPVLSWPS